MTVAEIMNLKKRYNHMDLTTTNTLPLLLNCYDPLCNDLVSDETPVGTQESRMAKSKHREAQDRSQANSVGRETT
jgi:hypothetical protein